MSPTYSTSTCVTAAWIGAYAAARMNAEHGRNYNVHKYLDWGFSRSAARPDRIMISGVQWVGQDVGGLIGGIRPAAPLCPSQTDWRCC